MKNPDKLKIENLDLACDFLSGGSARFSWVVGPQSIQSKRTHPHKVHESSIANLEKEGFPILNKFLESLGLKPLSIKDIKKEEVDVKDGWYHLTIDDKDVLDRLICAGKVKAFNNLLSHRLAAAICVASDTANDSYPLKEFPLYKPGINAKSFLHRYMPELEYENPPALYLKSNEKLNFPNAAGLGIEVSDRVFAWPSGDVKTCCFKIVDREKFLTYFDSHSWFDTIEYEDEMEDIAKDSRPREYWLVVNACLEMYGILVTSSYTTFGPLTKTDELIYFPYPEDELENQSKYFITLKQKLKDCIQFVVKEDFYGKTIAGYKVNYHALVDLYEKADTQKKLKEESKSLLQNIEQLKPKPVSTTAQLSKELKADITIPKYTALSSLNEEGRASIKAIKRKLNECCPDLAFGSLTMTNKEYIWLGEKFDKYDKALEFQRAVQISPTNAIEVSVIEFTEEHEEKYYVAFSKINLKELETLTIKISAESNKETSAQLKEATVPAKKTLSSQPKDNNNEKSDFNLS